MILFDDIGSFPLPKGINREWVEQAQKNNDPELGTILKKAMWKKIDAGVDVPTYPQFRDMIRMFMDPIEDPEAEESPYLIKKDRAEIFELLALKDICRDRPIRVCVTGPVELYISAFGSTGYEDIRIFDWI